MAHCTPPLGVVLEDKRQKQIKLCWSSSEEREKQSALCDRRQIGLWGKCVPGYFVRRAKVPIIIISGSFINFIFAHNKDKVSQSICHGPISGISRWYLSQFTQSSTSYSFPASNPVLSPLTALLWLHISSRFSSADRHIGARRPLGAPGGDASAAGGNVVHQQQPQQHGASAVGRPKSRQRRDTARAASRSAGYSHGK